MKNFPSTVNDKDNLRSISNSLDEKSKNIITGNKGMIIQNLTENDSTTESVTFNGDDFKTHLLSKSDCNKSSKIYNSNQSKNITAESGGQFELHNLSKFMKIYEMKQRKRYNREVKIKKNLSEDETHQMSQHSPKPQRRWSSSSKPREEKFKLKDRLKEKSFGRTPGFQRSFSCSQDADFVALNMDDDSGSSDVEQPNNKNWEIEMLVQEWEKLESSKRVFDLSDDDCLENEDEFIQLEDVKRLQKEVNTLKQMVSENDLTRLSTSELDMLETILEAKDKKISQIARSSSLDNEMKTGLREKSIYFGSYDSDSRLEKHQNHKRKKFSLHKKFGQAFSFDFHDIETKPKSHDMTKHKTPLLKKQKTLPEFNRGDNQNVYALWNTSNLLRHRVLKDGSESSSQCFKFKNSGSSLPMLISRSLNGGNNTSVRKSLPSLCGGNGDGGKTPIFARNSDASVCYVDEVNTKNNCNEKCDFILEKSDNFGLSDGRSGSTSGFTRADDGYSNNSLNNFIKSMGFKMKQVMVGEINAVKNQVPTISKLCDEQSMLNNIEIHCCADEYCNIERKTTTKEESKVVEDDGTTFDLGQSKPNSPDL